MEDVEGEARRHQRRRREWFGWGILLLLVAGFFFAISVAALAGMASDGCRSSTERPICSPVTQQVAGMLPIGGLVVGFLVGVIGGVIAMRRERSPVGWLGPAWGILVLADLISLSIATAK